MGTGQDGSQRLVELILNPRAGESHPEQNRNGKACLSLPLVCSLPGTGHSQLLRRNVCPETSLSLLLFPKLFSLCWSGKLGKHLPFFYGCVDSDTAGWVIQLMKPFP